MKEYYRITTYSPEHNICAIMDSHGRFNELWEFSAYLVKRKFKILAVSRETAFEFGNIPKAEQNDKLILRACQSGEPDIQGNRIEVNGKYYFKK